MLVPHIVPSGPNFDHSRWHAPLSRPSSPPLQTELAYVASLPAAKRERLQEEYERQKLHFWALALRVARDLLALLLLKLAAPFLLAAFPAIAAAPELQGMGRLYYTALLIAASLLGSKAIQVWGARQAALAARALAAAP